MIFQLEMPRYRVWQVRLLQVLLLLFAQADVTRCNRFSHPLHARKANNGTRDTLDRPSYCNLAHGAVLLLCELLNALDDLLLGFLIVFISLTDVLAVLALTASSVAQCGIRPRQASSGKRTL